MARFVKVLSTSLILRSRRLSREAFLIAAGFYAYSMLIFPGILTSVALIALFPLGAAYALSLYVNQWVAQRDLRTLYDDRVIDIPHILYLRSFDAEKSGVGFRLLRAIDPRRIASSTSFYTPAGREIYSFYDVEEQLADSFSRVGLVVAIGDKGTSFGATRVVVDDTRWQREFVQLTQTAAFIVLAPSASGGLLWEAAAIFADRDLLENTVLVMPRNAYADEWRELCKLCEERFQVTLRSYRGPGCFFRFVGRERSLETVELESFSAALAAWTKGTSKHTVGKPLAAIWRAAVDRDCASLPS